MKLQKIFTILFVAIAAITLHSCNSDSGESTMQVANIVTFRGNTDGQSVFTYQEMNDAQPVTIRSNQTIDESKVRVGDRVYILFNMPVGNQVTNNMVVDLLQAIAVPTINTVIETKPSDWETTTGLYVQTLFRSGTWLNLQALVPSSTTEMAFKLIADPQTINDGNVQLYLIYTNKSSDLSESNVPTFASFNIADVWNHSSCNQITVHIVNTNYSAGSEFTFKK